MDKMNQPNYGKFQSVEFWCRLDPPLAIHHNNLIVILVFFLQYYILFGNITY